MNMQNRIPLYRYSSCLISGSFIALSSIILLTGISTHTLSSEVLKDTIVTENTAKANQPSVRISGSWMNNRGSLLEIVKTDNNKLTGHFTTAVAHTKECIGYPAPVSGFINDNAITLSIDMSGCGSPVTISMTGAYGINKDDKEQINILGIVQRSGEDHWDSRTISSEYFLRVDTGAESTSNEEPKQPVIPAAE